MEYQIAALKKQLEEETLLQVDVENWIQSMKEELAFKDQLHEHVSIYLYFVTADAGI